MMKKVILGLIITYLWLNIPTFHDGLFHVYDNVQVTRVEALYTELRAGQFPVRYLDSFGHGAGYFLFKYYSPLVYYIATVFKFVGFSTIQAVKIVYLIFTLLGGLGTLVLIKSKTKGVWPAALGTFALLTSPYLFHDLFHRGSLTESAAFMLTPWAWWAFARVKSNPDTHRVVLAAFTLALTILAHSLTGVMVLGTMIIYLMTPLPKIKVVIAYLGAILLSILFSAFSIFPAISERNLISYENNSLLQSGYLDHPVPIANQLWGKPDTEVKSAFVGAGLFVSYLILLFLYFRSADFRKRHGELSIFILTIATGALFLMSPMSKWFWANIIYLRYFQFPFRLLTIATVAMTLGYALLVEFFVGSKLKLGLLIGMVLIPVIILRDHYLPLGYQYGTTYTVDDPCMTTTWADEYLSKWTENCIKTATPLLFPQGDHIDINNITTTDNGRSISFEAVGSGEVVVGKYYFPDWKALDENGKEYVLTPHGENGVIKIAIENNAKINIKLMKSNGDKWGDLISLLSLILSIVILILPSRKRVMLKPVKQKS